MYKLWHIGSLSSWKTLLGSAALLLSIQVLAFGQAPTVSASQTNYLGGGGSGTLTITVPTGTNWTATSNFTWLTVTAASGTGSQTIPFQVAANSSGNPARTAVVTVTTAGGSATASINEAALVSGWPTISLLNSLSSGALPATAQQTLQFQIDSPNGGAYINYAQILVNNYYGGAYSCQLTYYPANNQVALILQPGQAPIQYVLGQGGQGVANGVHCRFDPQASNAVFNGTGITLSLALTLQPSAVGAQGVWGLVTDLGYAMNFDSYINSMASWLAFNEITTAAPTASLTQAPSPTLSQVLHYKFSDGNGFTYMKDSLTGMLAPAATQQNTPCLFRVTPSRLLILQGYINGSIWALGMGTLGSSGIIGGGGFCRVDLSNSKLHVNPNPAVPDPDPNSGLYPDIYLDVAVSFDAATLLPQNAYHNTTDYAGRNTGWTQIGVWSAPPATQTITTTPTGLPLTVDSAACTSPCIFSQWIAGSTHTIAAATLIPGTAGTQYLFSSWSDGGTAFHTITTPSSSTAFTATFTTQYYLTTAASPGTGGSVNPTSGWYNAPGSVVITATANPGYQFSGFTGTVADTSPQINFSQMGGPVTETANFTAMVFTQTITTSPSGLALTVDGNACASPCTVSWATGSPHTIAAATTQSGGAGTQYLFASWSDGGAASHSVTAPPSAGTFTANFTKQYYLTTSASPAAGGSIVPASGWYTAGAVLTVTASANTGYQFSAFSGDLTGTNPSQGITLNAPRNITATFGALITVTTSPTGRSVTVDGAVYSAPYTFTWTAGSNHTISAATQAGATGTQYLFGNWSDGGDASHTITASSPTTYGATFTTQYQLSTIASPAGGGTISPSAGWYNAGAVLTVSATTNAGYQFTGFSNGLVGGTPQNLTLNGPQTVVANYTVSVTLVSSPANLVLTVDGSNCTSPCSFPWTPGVPHAVSAPAQSGGTGVQYVLANESLSAPSVPSTYTETFTTQYYLTTQVNPSNAGSITPATGWYTAGTVLSVSASPNTGYRFTGFSGGLTASTSPQNLTVNAAISITASFVVTATPGNSTVSASPASVVADGVTTSTITVTLRDAAGNPVSDRSVTLAQGTGHSVISAASGPSNASGVVTFTAKDTTAEAVVYTATDVTDGITITQTPSVSFIGGPVSASLSTMTTSRSYVLADGLSTSTITVTLKDTAGNVVSGKTVMLAQGPGHSTISPASGTSNSSGIVVFTVKDAIVEAINYTANDTTDSVTLTNTTTVSFIPPPNITSLSTGFAEAGTQVVITGTNFGSGGLVTFNDVPATVTSWTASSITTSVPTGAKSGLVVVTVNGAATAQIDFIVCLPGDTFLDIPDNGGDL